MIHKAADARNRHFLLAHNDVHTGGAHDHQHLPRLPQTQRRKGHMGIQDAGCHSRFGGQTRFCLGRRGYISRVYPVLPYLMGNLRAEDAVQTRIQRRQKIVGQIASVLAPEGFEPGHGCTAGFPPGQHPDQPVSRLNEAIGGLVDVGRLLQNLQNLREHPLGGNLAPIAGQPCLPPCLGQLPDSIRLLLGGVMLPQLHIGVLVECKFGQEAQRRSVRLYGNQSAGGEIHAHPGDLLGGYLRLADHIGENGVQHVQIIPGVLQSEFVGQRRAVGKCFIHDAMGIRHGGFRHYGAVGHANKNGTAGQGSVVDADGVFFHK